MSSRRSGPAHVAKDPDDPLNETMAHPLVHAKAQSWVPDVSIKPSSMWVAIVFHDVQSVSDMKEDATFLWIKCFPVRVPVLSDLGKCLLTWPPENLHPYAQVSILQAPPSGRL